jgi:uncharacterized SAM-binding protein YcdF (DUF218 family)
MYNLVVQLLMPFTLSCGLTWLALWLLWRKTRRVTRRWLLFAVPLAGLTFVSLPAVAYVAAGSLEWWYPPHMVRPAGCQAIVVLGGHVQWPTELRPQAELAPDTLMRCVHALDLYRQGPPCPIIACGGNVDSVDPGATLAEVMRDFLVSQGVPAADVFVETASRNTFQNVAAAVELLRQRNIEHAVVVTDASHLLRTELCFEAQGFPVQTSGCRYVATRFVWGVLPFVPSPHAAADVQDVAHEWLGLAWYWLRGWI